MLRNSLPKKQCLFSKMTVCKKTYLITCTFICVLATACWSLRTSVGLQEQNKSRMGENDELFNNQELESERRIGRSAVAPMANCNTWTAWVNDNHPTTLNKDDKEYISPKTMKSFCPYGNISNFQCKDDKGEPFQRNMTAPEGKFFISCYDVNIGVICTVLDHTLKHCPDMSIRYYCACPVLPSTKSGLNAHLVTAAASYSTKYSFMTTGNSRTTRSILLDLRPASLKTIRFVKTYSTSAELNPTRTTSTGAELKNGTQTKKPFDEESVIKIGNVSISRWIFVLIIVGLLCLFNTSLSLCLYRKATGKVSKRRQRKTNPSQFV